MIWVEILISCFVFYEAVVISLFKQLQTANPEWASWLILISKGVKLLLTVAAILLVAKLFAEIPLRRFALTAVAIYFVSLIFETIYFLKKKHNNEQQK